MSSSLPDWQRHTSRAMRLCDSGRFDQAVNICTALLKYHAIPWYYEIKCHALLACALDDWHEALEELKIAQSFWDQHREQYPEGSCADTDKSLRKLRGLLDETERDLARCQLDHMAEVAARGELAE